MRNLLFNSCPDSCYWREHHDYFLLKRGDDYLKAEWTGKADVIASVAKADATRIDRYDIAQEWAAALSCKVVKIFFHDGFERLLINFEHP